MKLQRLESRSAYAVTREFKVGFFLFNARQQCHVSCHVQSGLGLTSATCVVEVPTLMFVTGFSWCALVSEGGDIHQQQDTHVPYTLARYASHLNSQ